MTWADDEMLEGYLDGLKPESPEASSNRSFSYRHGFSVGRADHARRLAGRAEHLRQAAACAIEEDLRR